MTIRRNIFFSLALGVAIAVPHLALAQYGGYTVPAEIKEKHLRGSVATARTGDDVNPKRDSREK